MTGQQLVDELTISGTLPGNLAVLDTDTNAAGIIKQMELLNAAHAVKFGDFRPPFKPQTIEKAKKIIAEGRYFHPDDPDGSKMDEARKKLAHARKAYRRPAPPPQPEPQEPARTE